MPAVLLPPFCCAVCALHASKLLPSSLLPPLPLQHTREKLDADKLSLYCYQPDQLSEATQQVGPSGAGLAEGAEAPHLQCSA